MKTIWDWLEIDYTTDKQTIKKAYARQAKKYHPEEKPEEFKQLRNAYKTAMKYASDVKAWQPFTVTNESVAEVEKPAAGEILEPERESDEESEYKTVGQPKHNADEELGHNADEESGYKIDEEFEYQLGKGASKEQEPAEQRVEYTYNLSGNAESKGSNRQEKRSESRQEQQLADGQEQQSFVYSHEGFEPEMRARLLAFLRRIDIIYVDNAMCDNIKVWKMLFNYYGCKSDFYNHDFVAAVVDVFEQMPKLNKNIRRYIGRQLFSSKHNDVKMRYLKERYYNQQSYKIKRDVKQQQKKLLMKDVAGKLYGKHSKAYKKYNLINNCLVVVLICIIGTLMAYALKISDNNYEKPESTISTKFLTETQGEIVILERREVYKKRYTKDSPFVSDVNWDGYEDLVYYDSDIDEFMVEEYNPKTSDYMEAENVNDYCKRNIKARVKLFRFLQEDES